MAGRKRLESTSINLNPYQASRPFDIGYEPAFDFAREGRRISPALESRWEAPEEFKFKESGARRTQVDPYTKGVQEFRRGAGEDDLMLNLLGAGVEATGESDWTDPLGYAENVGKKFVGERSLPRIMGSVVSELPERGIKAAALGVKGGLAALKAAKGAGLGKTLFDIGAGGAAKGISAAGTVPGFGFRRDILDFGDIINRRLRPIDTSELTKIMKGAEDVTTPTTMQKFMTEMTSQHNPGGQQEFEDIGDIILSSGAGQAEINDELARRFGKGAGTYVPARTGAWPGLAQVQHAGTPATQYPSIYGRIGPHTDLGRMGFRGIAAKRGVEAAGGKRYLHKGSAGTSGSELADIAGSDPREVAAEAATVDLTRLLGGNAPEMQHVAEGGTIQEMMGPEFKTFTDKGYRNNPRSGNDPAWIRALQTPYTADQLAAEHARDYVGQVGDRNQGQFMFDAGSGLMVPVDKGFADVANPMYQNARIKATPNLKPEDVGASGGWMYTNLLSGRAPGTDPGVFAGLVSPDAYQEVAQKALSIPESTYRQTLDPLMEHWSIRSQADKDTAVRNFMRSIQGMPQELQDFYMSHIRP